MLKGPLDWLVKHTIKYNKYNLKYLAMCEPKTSTKPKLASYSDAKQFRSFLKGQVFGTIPEVTNDAISNPQIKNRTIIITGANSGLGLEASKQLIQFDCISRLVLACRSTTKGDTAREAVLACVPKDRKDKVDVQVWQLDMASKASIVAFSERTKRDLDRIDAVVLNAGVDLGSRYDKVGEEEGGYEMTLMVNVIGTIMLATLMVPVLREKTSGLAQTPRITITGSAVQFFVKYNVLVDAQYEEKGEGIFKWLSDEKRWKGKITEERYFFSKGLLQMLVRQLAARIQKGTVIINCVGPGYCETELFRESATMGSRIGMKLIGWEAKVGARSLVIGAIGKNGDEKSHGGYMSEGQVRDCSSWFETEQGDQIGRQLWKEVMDVTREVAPYAESSL